MVVGDHLVLEFLGCGDAIIDTTNVRDVIHAPSVGINILSIYCNTLTKK